MEAIKYDSTCVIIEMRATYAIECDLNLSSLVWEMNFKNTWHLRFNILIVIFGKSKTEHFFIRNILL